VRESNIRGAGPKPGASLLHVEASIFLSHGGQGEGRVPHYTRETVSLYLSRSLMGGRAKAWCLLIHAKASLCFLSPQRPIEVTALDNHNSSLTSYEREPAVQAVLRFHPDRQAGAGVREKVEAEEKFMIITRKMDEW